MSLLKNTAKSRSPQECGVQREREILFAGLACFVGLVYVAIKLFYQESLIYIFLLLSVALLFIRYFLGAKILLKRIKYRINLTHQAIDIFLTFFLILSIKLVCLPAAFLLLIALTYFLAALKHHLILREKRSSLIRKKRTLDIFGGVIFVLFAIVISLWGFVFWVSLLILISQIFGFISLFFIKRYICQSVKKYF